VDFDLSAEQRLLEESIDSFFAGSFPLSRVRNCYDAQLGPLDDLGALHLSEILIPEAYGGGGGTILDVAVAAERLGAAVAPGPFLGRVLASYAITIGGALTTCEWAVTGSPARNAMSWLATASTRRWSS